MTRRQEPLIPLTHDHHHALKHARALKVGAGGGTEGLATAAHSFVDFYDHHMLVHFREEEEQLLPMLVAEGGVPHELVARTMLEHVRIHALVRKLKREIEGGAPDPATALGLSDLLRSHVRMEEDKLFPLLEQTVPRDELSEIVLAPRTRVTAEEEAPELPL
jgi:hemerythrin-like domain-containing protein